MFLKLSKVVHSNHSFFSCRSLQASQNYVDSIRVLDHGKKKGKNPTKIFFSFKVKFDLLL
jgi:hypothetical protein